MSDIRLKTSKLFATQLGISRTLRKKGFENIIGKRENAGNQHFLFCQQYYLPFRLNIPLFQQHLISRLQSLSIWVSVQLCRLAGS